MKEPLLNLLPKTLAHRWQYVMDEKIELVSELMFDPQLTVEKKTMFQKRADELQVERDAIADLTDGVTQPVDVKHTATKYCSCCLRDYKPLELVQYIDCDNNTVCTACANSTHALRISTKEPRVYVPATEDYDYYRYDC